MDYRLELKVYTEIFPNICVDFPLPITICTSFRKIILCKYRHPKAIGTPYGANSLSRAHTTSWLVVCIPVLRKRFFLCA